MSLTNWDLITIGNIIRNADQNGESLRPDEWQSLLNGQSKLLFTELLGSKREYQPNMPISRVGDGITRKVSTALRPFLVTDTVAVTAGNVALNTALSETIAQLRAIIPATITGRPCDEIEPDEIADRVSDTVVSPTEADPVFYYTSKNSVTILPSTITSVSIMYYKEPEDCVVVITQNSTTLLQEYDESGSTELEWNDFEKMEILYRVLRDIGVNMERQDILQYADNIVKTEL